MGSSKSKQIQPVDIYQSRGEVLNLKGKIINIPANEWYNLKTNRINKNLPKDSSLLNDQKYRVFGNENELKAFYFRNYITTDTVCDLDTSGRVGYIPYTEDIEKVPEDYLRNLCQFNLIGLRSKAKIVEQVDADTIDLCFYLKLSFLYSQRPNLEKTEAKYQQVSIISSIKPTSPKVAKSGLFIKMRARLANIDAAEHNTKQGQLAIKMMSDLYAKTNNIVYVGFQEMDKYGRVLVDLYSDPQYKNYLNYYLIQNPDPILGKLADRYSGGTKDEYFKNLPIL